MGFESSSFSKSTNNPQGLKETAEGIEARIAAIAKSVDPTLEVSVRIPERSTFGEAGTLNEASIIVRKPSDKRFPKVMPYSANPTQLKESFEDLLSRA